MTDDNEIVGHKTFGDGQGGFHHEPLTKGEADTLLDHCEALRLKREAAMPDEQSAIDALFQAYQRLRELGWADAVYSPKDGRNFKSIETGSTGIFDCHYAGEWPNGGWWSADGGDLYPSRPCLFKLYPADQAQHDERMKLLSAAWAKEQAEKGEF